MRDIRQLMASGASNNADAPDVAMPDVAPLEGSGATRIPQESLTILYYFCIT